MQHLQIWIFFRGAHRLRAPGSRAKFFEYFVVIVFTVFLAKEEYKVRYDEKEREAKDLNEKVTVSYFCYTKEVTLGVAAAELFME